MSQPPSPAEGTSGAWSRVLPMVWAALLAGLMLGPALGPGLVLSYDMVWVPDLTLRPDFWGLGSSLPRAVPSDVVVSLVDDVLPGAVLQKAVLFGSLAGAGLGIDRLARDWLGARLPARLAAVAAYAWSPYVAERLLLGHWPMLLCYATLPWVLHATNRWREEGQLPAALPLLLVAGSLSASAGVATAIALLATLVGAPVRRLLCGLALAAAANAPWVVAGLLHAGNSRVDPRGAEVFALSGEGPVPAPLAALTLGGVWNREVVPTSRTGLLGWMALGVLALLIVVGARTLWRRLGRRNAATLAGCWAVGYALAVATWLFPEALAWSGEHVPGAAVLRDGSRLLVLCAPLVALLVAAALARLTDLLDDPAVRGLLAVALVLCPLLLMSDAAWGLRGQLRPVDLPADYAAAREAIRAGPPGDVLVLPLTSYRRPAWNHGLKVLDPAGRSQTRNFVTSDELVVSGTVLAGEDPRVQESRDALAAATPELRASRLKGLGFGAVLIDRTAPGHVPEVDGARPLDGQWLRVVTLDGARPRPWPDGWVVAMSLAWSAFGGLVLLAITVGARRAWRGRPRP